MPVKPYRCRYEIANDILHVVSDSPLIEKKQQTSIGYSANLTHKQTVKFIRGLTNQGAPPR
ncbi:MAG: winged helix-turn-helix domain-containing protein [Nitrososphaeraceae archaeon]|jgi:predicted transcriptional regulator